MTASNPAAWRRRGSWASTRSRRIEAVFSRWTLARRSVHGSPMEPPTDDAGDDGHAPLPFERQLDCRNVGERFGRQDGVAAIFAGLRRAGRCASTARRTVTGPAGGRARRCRAQRRAWRAASPRGSDAPGAAARHLRLRRDTLLGAGARSASPAVRRSARRCAGRRRALGRSAPPTCTFQETTASSSSGRAGVGHDRRRVGREGDNGRTGGCTPGVEHGQVARPLGHRPGDRGSGPAGRRQCRAARRRRRCTVKSPHQRNRRRARWGDKRRDEGYGQAPPRGAAIRLEVSRR